MQHQPFFCQPVITVEASTADPGAFLAVKKYGFLPCNLVETFQ